MAESNLQAKLTLDDTQFQQVLRTAAEAANKAAEKTGSAWKRIAEFATGSFLADAAAKGISALAGFGVEGIKSAAAMEQTTVAFETLLGSADKAKSLLADLQKLGADTPFEFPELADAGRKLVAFGTDARLVIPTLTMIGDVASGIQIPIGELADIYGKARVQGKLMAEDVNQLTGRGVPIIGEFAKQFGVTEGNVKNLVETGRVGFKNLEDAFISLTTHGGSFFGMMQKQSHTFSGLWSTVMDNVGQLQRAFATPMVFALKPVLDKLNASLPAMMDIAGRIGTMLASGFSFVVGFLEKFGASSDPFKYVGLSLKAELADAASFFLARLADGIGAVGNFLASGALDGLIQGLKNGLADAASFFVSKLADALSVVAESLGKANSFMSSMMSGVGEALKKASQKAGDGTIMGSIGDALKSAADSVHNFASKMGEAATAAIKTRDAIGSNDADAIGVTGRASLFRSTGMHFNSPGVQFGPGMQFSNYFAETAGGALDRPLGSAVDGGWGTGGLQTSGLLTGRSQDVESAQRRRAADEAKRRENDTKKVATEATLSKIEQAFSSLVE